MLKAPLFKIEPLIESLYLEQVGHRKLTMKEYRATNRIKKSLNNKIPARWVFIKHEEKEYPILLMKSKTETIILHGPESIKLKKAKTEKDLEYWKKKLADTLDMEKSLKDILFPGTLLKSLPEETQDLLIKARGFSVGTIRTWSGKEYKKVSGGKSGSGKWVRTYSEEESRGAKQAIRNVKKKILEAKSMGELLEIVKENKARFKDKDGKALPIVAEFLKEARGSDAGVKIKNIDNSKEDIKTEVADVKTEARATSIPLSEDEGEEIAEELNEKYNIPEIEFYSLTEFGETNMFVAISSDEKTEHIPIDPQDMRNLSSEDLKNRFGVRGKDKQKRKDREGDASILENKEELKEQIEQMTQEAEDSTEKEIERDDLVNEVAESVDSTPEEIVETLGVKEKISNQRKVSSEKRAKNNPPKKLEGYDPTLDPNSEEYKYRDTGYIGGSRKEIASLQIKELQKSGQTVIVREIDWSDLEENPREAESLVLKRNLFGLVDWDEIEKTGMEPGAGFLIDRVYSSLAPKPENDPIKRKDYAYGLESVRKRMEESKTVQDVLDTLTEIREEMAGVVYTAEESKEIEAVSEKNKILYEKIRAIEDKNRVAYDEMVASNPGYKLERDISNRKARGWKYDKQEQQLKEAKEVYEKKQQAWRDSIKSTKEEKNQLEAERSKTLTELHELKQKALRADYERNPTKRAWFALGERFQNVTKYRYSSGSSSFQKHVYRAKRGDIRNWDWAKKEKVKLKKTGKKNVRFQLQVSDSFKRKGGKPVKVDGTVELKEMFNLRDVESGNWVLKDPASAKFHIERSAEAFSDLSDMTGIPTDKLSFNGRLAMAYGARGKGGSGAVAHYEPIKRVINLTKMGGGGSLAHEWFHSLDNLINEVQGIESNADEMGTAGAKIKDPELNQAFQELVTSMTTGDKTLNKEVTYTPDDYKIAVYNIEIRPNALGREIKSAGSLEEATKVLNPLREKVNKSLDDIATALNEGNSYAEKSAKSRLRKNKKNLNDWETITVAYYGGNKDGGIGQMPEKTGVSQYLIDATELESGSNEYWATNIEMSARAFSAYIEDKLESKNRISDYLSSGSNNARYAMFNQKPFPEGEERKKINEKMENLFNVINKNNIISKSLDEYEVIR